jgi:hypothetical protein
VNQYDIDKAHDAFVRDVIDSAEKKLGRRLTNRESDALRPLSFMVLELIAIGFMKPATTAEQVERALAYYVNEDRPTFPPPPMKRPLWKRLLRIA